MDNGATSPPPVATATAGGAMTAAAAATMPTTTTTTAAPPPRKAPKPRRALYRLAAPRRSAAARDLEELEQRYGEARRQHARLEARNADLRRHVSLLAGEFQALDMLVRFGGGAPQGEGAAAQGGLATTTGDNQQQQQRSAGVIAGTSRAAAPAVDAGTALLDPVGFGARAFRQTLGLAYLRQQESLQLMGVSATATAATTTRRDAAAGSGSGSGSGGTTATTNNKNSSGGGSSGGNDTTAADFLAAPFSAHRQQQQPDDPAPIALPDDPVTSADPIFCASLFGLLGSSPQEAAAAIQKVAAERHARRPLGPQPLEAAVALFRDLATRSALLLRRLELLEREHPESERDEMCRQEEMASLRKQVDDLAVETLAWHAIMLKHHPEALDELIVVRLDDPRSPPARHDDHELQSRLGRAAVRSAKLSPAQHAQLKAAFEAFTRQMAEPARLMRRAGRQLKKQLRDPAVLLSEDSAGTGGEKVSAPLSQSVASPSSPSSRQLLETIERCAAACSMHRVLIGMRTYCIVTPMQFVGLVADCYPFLMRPGSLYSAFFDVSDAQPGGGGGCGGDGSSDEEEDEDEGGGGGGGAGNGQALGGGVRVGKQADGGSAAVG